MENNTVVRLYSNSDFPTGRRPLESSSSDHISGHRNILSLNATENARNTPLYRLETWTSGYPNSRSSNIRQGHLKIIELKVKVNELRIRTF